MLPSKPHLHLAWRYILCELNKKIRARNREDWFKSPLTTFINMSTFGFALVDVIDYITRHGLKLYDFPGCLIMPPTI
jgi:hypothetical protein